MATATVVDTDRGWRRMLEQVASAARGPTVKIGVIGSEAGISREDGIAQAALASVHEYGTRDGRIPERAPIRRAVDGHRLEIEALQAKLWRQVLAGTLTHDQALSILGVHVKGKIQSGIEAGLEPDIADSTKEDKTARGLAGPHKPLIETGSLKNAYSWELDR